MSEVKIKNLFGGRKREVKMIDVKNYSEVERRKVENVKVKEKKRKLQKVKVGVKRMVGSKKKCRW